MDKIIFCEFNIDTPCVEVKCADGSMISIDCTRVENEIIMLRRAMRTCCSMEIFGNI